MLAQGNFYAHRGKSSGDGFQTYCKPCTKLKAVAWQKANPEKKAASDKKQDAKPSRKAIGNARHRAAHAKDPSKVHARTKAWASANPERTSARTDKWNAENPERVKAYQRKHYHEAPGRRQRCMDHARLYRAFHKDRAINGPGGERLDEAYWFAVLAAFGNACCYCGIVTTMTIEHLTPLRRGGRNERGNIACACLDCNQRKKAMPLEEFAPSLAAEIRRRAFICTLENDNGAIAEAAAT